MIYLATHTDFNEYKKEGEYKIISVTELKNKYSFLVQFRTICMDDMDDGRTTSTLVKFEKLPGIFSEKEIYMHAMLKI